MRDIIIGIPSKGRLKDNCEEIFKNAGFIINRLQGERSYRARFEGIDGIEISLLSASEIVNNLRAGDIDLGITGLDLLYENIRDYDSYIHNILRLDFGYADVVVVVPEFWVDVNNMRDFDEVAYHFHKNQNKKMRVATKYFNLTRKFFRDNDVVDYRIVGSAGATEGSVAAGSAEIIVDITSTGSTIKANHLKILTDGVILKSQACLAASKKASWDEININKLQLILDKLEIASKFETELFDNLKKNMF